MPIPSPALAWSILAALTGVAAMAAPTPTPVDPSDPQATVPPLLYQSPLAGVRKLNDAVLRDWRSTAAPSHRAASSPAEALSKPDPHAGHSHSRK